MSSYQLELPLERPKESDRNHEQGGRSFYFFDIDDNIINLSTPIILFHKITHAEKLISSQELAEHGKDVGVRGPFIDYYYNYDDAVGSFRNFRDVGVSKLQRLFGKRERFEEDIRRVISMPESSWKAASWKYFYYATFNQRPVSLITARGHYPETIKKGLNYLHEKGFIEHRPNYLSVYPVSNLETRKLLGDSDFKQSVSELKKRAIIKSVEKAIELYGENPHHRFGMSDDDKKNVELITEAMLLLKKRFPLMSFFVIDTHSGTCIKKEILENRVEESFFEGKNDIQFMFKE